LYSLDQIYGLIQRHFWRKVDNITMREGQYLRIGSQDNYAQFDINGVSLAGTSTVWDDFRLSAISSKLPTSNAPDFVLFKNDGGTSVGTYAYAFDKNTNESVFYVMQLPHNWKEGSDLKAHVHWCPIDTGTGNVRWALEYTWANIGGTFGNATSFVMQDAADGTAYKHQMTDATTLTATGKTHSSMLVCRLFRSAVNAADTYDNDAIFLELDFHYEVESLGDRDTDY